MPSGISLIVALYDLQYKLDQVFQEGGMREIELASEQEVSNKGSFPIASPSFTFTSTKSDSFSFELAEDSVMLSGTSTTTGGRRRLGWAAVAGKAGKALLKAAPIIIDAIPVSASNTRRPGPHLETLSAYTVFAGDLRLVQWR